MVFTQISAFLNRKFPPDTGAAKGATKSSESTWKNDAELWWDVWDGVHKGSDCVSDCVFVFIIQTQKIPPKMKFNKQHITAHRNLIKNSFAAWWIFKQDSHLFFLSPCFSRLPNHINSWTKNHFLWLSCCCYMLMLIFHPQDHVLKAIPEILGGYDGMRYSTWR